MSQIISEDHMNKEDDIPIKHKKSQQKTNLYVKNFGNDMNEKKLCELFGEYGKINSCKIAKDEDNRSKGFGFVNFLSSSMAEDAINNLDGYQLKNGKRLYVGFFQNKKDRQEEQKQIYYKTCKDRNLFISNLDEYIEDQHLKRAFMKYGIIISAKVMVKRGRSKGYGFVCFSTADEAAEAIEHMNGKVLGSKPIYVSLNRGQNEHSQSSNHDNPEKSIDTQLLHPSSRRGNVLNSLETSPSTSLNRQSPPIIQFSTRLSSRLSVPIAKYPSPIHLNEDVSGNNHDSSS